MMLLSPGQAGSRPLIYALATDPKLKVRWPSSHLGRKHRNPVLQAQLAGRRKAAGADPPPLPQAREAGKQAPARGAAGMASLPSGRWAGRHQPATASLSAALLPNSPSSPLPLKAFGTPHPGKPAVTRQFHIPGSGPRSFALAPEGRSVAAPRRRTTLPEPGPAF